MDLPLQLVVFSTPAIVYAVVCKQRGDRWPEVFDKIGWKGSQPIYFLWSLGVVIIAGGLGWLTFQTVPSEVWLDPNLNVSRYKGLTLGVTSFLLVWLREAIYITLGEEVFFRGFLGGWLFRQLGFATGNTVQTLIFLLPHLPLLSVSQKMWPTLIIPLIAGWLLGWLRYRSESILPGWLAHSLSNAIGALVVMGRN